LNQKKAAPSAQKRPRFETPPTPPPGLAARQAAAAAFADVVANGRSLDERFAADSHFSLDVRDRALARSIVVASLRRLGTIRAALARFLERGLPKKAGPLEYILTTSAAQILFMDVPDHAAVDLAVHAARADQRSAPFAALVNAVLRNIAREKESMLAVEDPFLDMPMWLAARWRKAYGEDVAARMAVQAHGAMGMTWEVDLHFYLKRAFALNYAWGTPAVHSETVMERVAKLRTGPDATFADEVS
jgi:16S rRNA (cytosine967-C5)-methyltransferase